MIAVEKFSRGNGYGKQLLKKLIEVVSVHCQYILLEVSKTNGKALGLYRHYGFEIMEDRGEKILMRKIIDKMYL